MPDRRRILPLVLLAVLFAPLSALAQDGGVDTSERGDQLRAAMLRRMSEAAKTGEAGLDEAGTAFLDLYLDLQRNREAIRAGRAPRLPSAMGVPHGEMSPLDDAVLFRARFVSTILAEERLTLAGVPAFLETLLDPGRFARAGLPGEDPASLEAWRLQLILDLVDAGDSAFLCAPAARAGYVQVRPRIIRLLVEGLDAATGQVWHRTLRTLRHLGGDEEAAELIQKLEALPPGYDPAKRHGLVGTIAAMEGKVARDFLKRTLREGPIEERCCAATAVGKDADEETIGLLVALLGRDDHPNRFTKLAVLDALASTGSPEAEKALVAYFEAAEDDSDRHHAACALLRMGSEVAVEWVEAQIVALEKKGDHESLSKAHFLKGALKELREGREGK